MPSMSTVSKVVMLPNEYKERMDAGYFNPDFTGYGKGVPDHRKPLIYVTHPNDMEEEIWAPPPQEHIFHQRDSDSDDGTCSCSHKSIPMDVDEDKYTEKDMLLEVESVTSSHDEVARDANEMWMYRTGWQNRTVQTTDDKNSQMLYYVDIPFRGWGTSLSVLRGSRQGESVAEVHRRGPGRPFEITFSDARQLRHVNDDGKLLLKFGCIYSRTHKFVYRGRNLAWRGYYTRRLRDLDTDEIIAEFKPAISIHKDGKLTFNGDYAKDPSWVDLIVVSTLTCQQREREIRRASASAGGGGGGGGGC
jgi:hypothetical protein